MSHFISTNISDNLFKTPVYVHLHQQSSALEAFGGTESHNSSFLTSCKKLPRGPAHSPPEHMSKIINFRCSGKSLHTNIHSSIIYNTQKKSNSNTIKTLKGSLLKGGGGFTSFSRNSQETPSRKSHEPFQICHALLTPKSDRAISVWNCHQL